MKDTKKGFTLIELLVVIAIIGLLSAVVLAALNTARAKGRDAERLSDMHQIQTALEEYATSNNGSYPSTGGSNNYRGVCSAWSSGGPYTYTGSSGYIPNLAPTYISVLPADPAAPLAPNYDPTQSCYIYTSDGKDYKLTAWNSVEGYKIGAGNYPHPNPVRTGYADFSFYSTGGSGW